MNEINVIFEKSGGLLKRLMGFSCLLVAMKMEVKLKLVSEKKLFLDYFTFSNILGTWLLLIMIPTFFIIPFLDKNSMNWFFPYFISLFVGFVISWIVMYLKFFTTYDYDCIGKLVLSNDKITLAFESEEKEIELENNSVKLLYNGIRKIGFQYGRDFPRSGIFEIIINDFEKYYSVINSYDELEKVKKILKIWYQKKFDINEFTRTKENHRLIELEMKFDWARLNEIKSNATNTR